MLKGFAITPVTLGRISIGGTVEKNGKRIPVKHDFFTITSNSQKDGQWVQHPVAEKLTKPDQRLLSIPVRLMFDEPDNNFRAQYTAFSEKGRMICTGDGDQAKRLDANAETGVSDCACPGHERCAFGKTNRCKPYGRLLVGIEEIWQRDPLAGFMLRTTSWNTIRALTARLSYLYAVSGKKLGGMPCNLVLRSKSTASSMRQPIYYVDIEPRDDLLSAIAEVNRIAEAWKSANIDREALEKAVSNGYSASAFVEADDEGEEIVAEFFGAPEGEGGGEGSGGETGQRQPGEGQSEGDDAGQQEGRPRQGSPVSHVMSELEAKSLNESISRLKNIQHEQGLKDALTWARTRYAAFPDAVKQLEEAIDKRGEAIRAAAGVDDGQQKAA